MRLRLRSRTILWVINTLLDPVLVERIALAFGYPCLAYLCPGYLPSCAILLSVVLMALRRLL